MTISQLSVFAENKAGSISTIANAMAGAGVDIRAFNVAETKDFGVLRFIVNDAARAKEALAAEGCVVSITQVIGVAMPDSPGGLAKVLGILSAGGMNIEYLYAFVAVSGSRACVVLRVEDNEAAAKLLTDAGLELLSDEAVRAM